MEYEVLTTRFKNDTYEQYISYKEKHNITTSIYNSIVEIRNNIPVDAICFVLEMNNDINKIMGIGIIVPLDVSPETDIIRIFDNRYLNTHTYKGDHHLTIYRDGKSLLDEEKSKYIQDEFEKHLFYGKGNMKRGGGFTAFPKKKLKEEHVDFLIKLFPAMKKS